MSQPSFDFGDEALDDAANPTFTVSELAEVVNATLRRTFSDGVWVRGEIQGWSERGGHAYFTLADDTPGRQAVLRVQFFANARMRVRPLLERFRLRLGDGMKVRLFGHLDYYAPSGQLGLKMTDLDPRFTLGDLAQQREQVLRRLAAEGALEANGRRRLSPVPLRVGVVSSAGTAAWHDFHDELARSGLGFHLVLARTIVQGPGAAAASRARSRRCRRTPSATGSTPSSSSAAAGRATSWPRSTPSRSPGPSPPRRCRCSPGSATRSTAAWPTTPPTRRSRPRRPAPGTSWRWCGATSTPSSSATSPCVAAARARLTAGEQAVADRAHRIARRTHAAVERADERLGTRVHRLRAAATRPVLDGERRLDVLTQRFVTRVPQLLATEDRHLTAVEARVRALDPVNVLARGWSITRAPDGRVVRSPADVADGDVLTTAVAGGTLRSRVEGRP